MSFSSFYILLFLAVGLLLGATVFPAKLLRVNNWMMTAGIALLLFTMGVSMGSSPTLMEDIANAGTSALAISSAAVAGSVLVVWFLLRLFERGRKS